MSIKQFDSRTADKFVARLPDGLRAEIEAIANGSDRSMNAVFVQAVRQYTDGQKRQQLLLDALANAAGPSLHIDERVRMAANARRYEWLRDVAFNTSRQDLLPRDRQGNMLTERDLDAEIDLAMHQNPGEQEFAPCAE